MLTKPKVYFRIVEKISEKAPYSQLLKNLYGESSLDFIFNRKKNSREENSGKVFYLPYNLEEKSFEKKSRKRVENGVYSVIRERYGRGVGSLSIGSVFANEKPALSKWPIKNIRPREFADSLKRFFDFFDNLSDPNSTEYDPENEYEMEFIDEVDQQILVIEHGVVSTRQHSSSPSLIRWQVQADIVEDKLEREYTPIPDDLLDNFTQFRIPYLEELPILGPLTTALNQTNEIINNIGKNISVIESYIDSPNQIARRISEIQANTALHLIKLERLAKNKRLDNAKAASESSKTNMNAFISSTTENNETFIQTSQKHNVALDAMEAKLVFLSLETNESDNSSITTDESVQAASIAGDFSLNSLSLTQDDATLIQQLNALTSIDTLFMSKSEKASIEARALEISNQITHTDSTEFARAMDALVDETSALNIGKSLRFTTQDTITSSDITINDLSDRLKVSQAGLIEMNNLVYPYVSLRFMVVGEKIAELINASSNRGSRTLIYSDIRRHYGTVYQKDLNIVLITNDAFEMTDLLQFKTTIDASYFDTRELYLSGPLPFDVDSNFRVELYYATTSQILGLGETVEVPH